MSETPHFGIAAVDEIWSMDGGRTLTERRISHGVAEARGTTIVATDSAVPELMKAAAELAVECRHAIEMMIEGRARIVASARTAGDQVVTAASIAMSIQELSVLASRDTAARHYELLRELASVRAEESIDYHTLPIVWRRGSASVLLHEAVGHAAELHHEPIGWPEWLSVHDEPDFEADDAGVATAVTDLLGGDTPQTLRRASFADVPLRRMSRVVARQSGAFLDLPPRRIEVHLVSAGRYDRLTQIVTLYVAAAHLVDGSAAVRLRPFIFSERREGIAAAVRGAAGDPEGYPGVVCSSEGQELVVGSYAPLILTVFG